MTEQPRSTSADGRYEAFDRYAGTVYEHEFARQWRVRDLASGEIVRTYDDTGQSAEQVLATWLEEQGAGARA